MLPVERVELCKISPHTFGDLLSEIEYRVFTHCLLSRFCTFIILAPAVVFLPSHSWNVGADRDFVTKRFIWQ